MFKKIIKKLVYGHKASSEAYIEYLRVLALPLGRAASSLPP